MRFFVEGLALAALTFLITLKPFGNLPDMPLRITVTLLVCMGPFLLGTIGIGGEPITVAITGFFKWLGSRKVMLYNANARATTRAQGDIFIEREANRKTIDDVTESMKRKLMSKPTTVYEEGVNFTFADKEYLDDMYKQDSHEGIIVGSIDGGNNDDDSSEYADIGWADEEEAAGMEVKNENMPLVVLEGNIIFEKKEDASEEDHKDNGIDVSFDWVSPADEDEYEDEETPTEPPQSASGVTFDDVCSVPSETHGSAQCEAGGHGVPSTAPAKKKRRRKKKKNPNAIKKEENQNG